MRWLRNSLFVAALVALAGLSALNWRAQLQTQHKLDELTAALADRPAAPTPVEAVAPPPAPAPKPGEGPKEPTSAKLPPYVIEAPDMLLIEVVVKDPKTGTADRLPTQPISGPFQVRLDGTVGLGFWESVSVTGLTLEQATGVIRAQLLKNPVLVQAGVRPETLTVIVDILAYNSKRYYLISDFAGRGEQVYAFPLTGNETVLDAVASVGGLSETASRAKVWVARPGPNGGSNQVLPVDWKAITQSGITKTNYQIMPGDRVYIKHAAD